MPHKVIFPGSEWYDEETDRFIVIEPCEIELEHSLAAVSRWESIWKKPFLSKENKTREEIISYIECMATDSALNDKIFSTLPNSIINDITAYIQDPMTATTFNDRNAPKNREIITSEVIYYWMFSNGIPLECENWNLNRLMALLRVCAIKNSDPQKMKPNDILREKYRLNNQRLKRH